MTEDLIAWLRAQLDDEETQVSDQHVLGCEMWDLLDRPDVGDITDEMKRDPALCTCRCRFALVDIDAKRRIIDHVAPIADGTGGWRWFQGSESEAAVVIKLLALPFADRPGYQESWRP